MGERELTSKERKAVKYLAALDSSMTFFEGDLEERLKSIPDGWRRYRVARGVLGPLMQQLYESVPLRARLFMAQAQKNEEIVIRPRAIVEGQGLRIVPESLLSTLINISAKSECSICIKTPSEVRSCKLRRELMDVFPPSERTVPGRCPYLDKVILQD
jgi:hypothetical protein